MMSKLIHKIKNVYNRFRSEVAVKPLTQKVFAFLEDPTRVDELIEELNKQTKPLGTGSQWTTCGIHFCNDRYGYEISLGQGDWLDLHPQSYGLTVTKGRELEKAILALIPGSIYYRLPLVGKENTL
jgi:hypothetical protein